MLSTNWVCLLSSSHPLVLTTRVAERLHSRLVGSAQGRDRYRLRIESKGAWSVANRKLVHCPDCPAIVWESNLRKHRSKVHGIDQPTARREREDGIKVDGNGPSNGHKKAESKKTNCAGWSRTGRKKAKERRQPDHSCVPSDVGQTERVEQQCRATTKAGTRCSHTASHEADGVPLCAQHFVLWKPKRLAAQESSGGARGTLRRRATRIPDPCRVAPISRTGTQVRVALKAIEAANKEAGSGRGLAPVPTERVGADVVGR